MEYKEFYVAQSTVLKGTGPVKFDYRDRHSSLADVAPFLLIIVVLLLRPRGLFGRRAVVKM